MKKRLRGERGQMLVLTAVVITGLLGMTAFVLDVGSWFREHRRTQAIADAAALAGAQKLPDSPSSASSLAIEYANSKNGGSISGGDVTFQSNTFSNDTITVQASATAPSFFAKIFGIDSVSVGAKAVARAYNLGEATYAAPFGIDKSEPMLTGAGCPCYEQSTVLDLEKVGPGGFKIMNIDGSQGGTSPATLADWIANGYSGSMPTGWYYSDPGAKFNSSHVKNALDASIGNDLLFPVYDNIQGQGANLQYHVAGWAVLHLTDWAVQGNNGSLTGYFTHVAWQGVESTSASNYFGAVVIKLVG